MTVPAVQNELPDTSKVQLNGVSVQGGLTVTFTDLEYKVKVKKEDKAIISGISGMFQPGKLTALMGPSGSGKTTLMDLLAGRKQGQGSMTGEVLYGGKSVSKNQLRNLCGYVEQFDTLVSELTVFQMLMYTAELKCPPSMGKKDKQQKVEEVIELLHLEKCKDTKIGNALMRGISGGQAKRVNIAVALVTSPKIVFLDEPTSGLDSRMANEVCIMLESLAKQGCTVVATIHSPTGFAFSLFNELMMLQSGGQLAYVGAVDASQSFFEKQGYPFDGKFSLPDWLVEITSGNMSADGVVSYSTFSKADAPEAVEARDFSETWKNSEEASKVAENLSTTIQTLKGTPQDVDAAMTGGGSQLHALKTLLAYRGVAHFKDGEFLGPRIGDKIFMAVLISTLYWQIADEADGQAIQSTASLLYFVVALCGYGAAAYVPALTLERALFFRERADGCYFPITYYASKFIEEASLCTITSIVFVTFVHFALSLKGNFLLLVLGYWLSAMTGIVLAYLVAALAPNMDAANAMLPTYVTTCMYFGGLFILFDEIPVGWKWYSYTSFLRYAWGCLMLNNYKDDALGAVEIFVDFRTGARQNILEFYGMDEGIMNSVAACYLMLAGLLLFFATLGVLALQFINHVKR